MLVHCTHCGFEARKDPKTEIALTRMKDDMESFLIRRTIDNDHTAKFLRKMEVACPICGNRDGWATTIE